MPGASNPVASTPTSVPHSKSFRTRLGFGGSSGVVTSTKPSFFSQLKHGRKSFGGPGEFRPLDLPVLVIDPEPERAIARHETRVVLNEETGRNKPLHGTVSSSKSRIPTIDSPHRQIHITSHSLPSSPAGTQSSFPHLNPRSDSTFSHVNGITSESPLDPDESGLSKHLPDLSADLSLLMNEPSPVIGSQSDLHDFEISVPAVYGGNTTALKEKEKADARLPGSSPAAMDNHDQTQRWNLQELAATVHQIRAVASSPPGVSHDGPEASESAVSGLTNVAVENASASFDLSSAKLSLDFLRHSIGEEWANSLVEGSVSQNPDTSAMLVPPESSIVGSSSGPVTSTPFLSPIVSPLQSQHPEPEPEISFNLDALDPDLVALLRPNNFNQNLSQMKRIATPSPLEPFSPPPDPLNPDTTVNPPAMHPTSRATAGAPQQAEKPTPSPVRKYATLISSTSPARPLRLQRSYTAQDIVPSSLASKPSTMDNHLDLPRLQTHAHDDAWRSPSSVLVCSSDTGTPSDASKHPSPLSAPPLTLSDLEQRREPSPAQSSNASTSTSNNVTARRVRTAALTHIQPPRPTSSMDSRPTSRYAPRDREHDPRLDPSPPGPPVHPFATFGRERERVRPSMDDLFPARFSLGESTASPSSAGDGRSHPGPSLNSMFPLVKEHEWETAAERRYRKRSMSLDQSPAGMRLERRGDDTLRGGVESRLNILGNGDRMADSLGYGGSELGYGTRSVLGAPYGDRDRERERYGYGYGDRERYPRPHTDWLGPRTAKAFAAAGLLDEQREPSSSRFTRSISERDVRTVSIGSGRERLSPNAGYPPTDIERDRGNSRYNVTSSVRSGSDRDFRFSGVRTGAESPNIMSATRPPSRGESWSHGRPAPLFARTASDLRASVDSRESVVHPRPASAYSVGGGGTGGGSAGSGGGRASPTTTSSLAVVQSAIQALKDKHDTQTEALLAALADSQKVNREMREENEALKGQLRALEERLADAITGSRQKERELTRALRARPPHVTERTRIVPSRRDTDFPRPPGPPLAKPPARSTPSPTKRRLSTTSSVFPVVPGSMTMLMAETPGSPPQGSLSSRSSPPSPTLILPKLALKQKSPEWRDIRGGHAMPLPVPESIPMAHKRSTSGASTATSANFSYETGSPGSLKLKPEHELLLGDMTRLSLVTGFGGDSESES